MPIPSRWTLPIPACSLPSYVFGSASGPVPDRIAFVDAADPARRLTLGDFRHQAKRIAAGLRARGIGPGDAVLVVSANDIMMPCLFMGVVMAGAIFTGASPAYGPAELAHQLRDSGARLVVAHTAVVAHAVEAARPAGVPVLRFDGAVGGDDEPGPGAADAAHWSGLLASDADAAAFAWAEPADPAAATVCLNYSSGTTGPPKGVEVTHRAYVANAETAAFGRRIDDEAAAAAGHAAGPARALCLLPLYHAAAQTSYCVNAPHAGIETFVMAEYSLEAMLRAVERHAITDMLVAPPVLVALVASPLRRRFDLASLRAVTCGTAPLAPDVAARAAALLPPAARLRQAWGMTELTCLGTLVDTRLPDVPGSVGEVAPNSAVRLVDADSGRDVDGPHRRAELWFAGPTVMKGYWRNPVATARAVHVDADGTRWLKTGDVVVVDRYAPGATLRIVDRAKELIKVKGFQVAPAELEALLLTRRDVVDAAVVGLVRPADGAEMPRAYVVRAPDAPAVSEDELCRWVAARVAAYKQLRGGVAFVDAIPKIPSGKILRRLLRERAQAELARGLTLPPKL